MNKQQKTSLRKKILYAVFVTLLFIIYYIFLYKPLVLPSFENRKITENP